jgi:hypothetical protein
MTIELDESAARYPSTMYTILSGIVQDVEYVDSSASLDNIPDDIPSDGIMLGYYDLNEEVSQASIDPRNYWDFSNYRGALQADYFVIRALTNSGGAELVPIYYFYVVSAEGAKAYSEPLWLTGDIDLATETVVGGFLNVPQNARYNGYVYLDETGHLRLLDYELLASGVLAYQLGEDFTTSVGLGMAGIQEELDEYVNNRIAFPNANHATTSSTPDVINITVTITEDGEETTTQLNFMNIDSRFNTSVCIHLLGVASDYTFNFVDCQKLRIDNQLRGSYTLNSYRSNLYYDAGVLDDLNVITDLSLWYERYDSSDPDIIVNDMSVELVGTPTDNFSVEYWTGEATNDNHYAYALKGVTFAKDGTLCGCKLLVTDNITGNNQLGKFASVFPFTLPQSSGLSYPASKLVNPLKVTGSFISSYTSPTISPAYIMKDTSFTALTQYTTTQLSSTSTTETVEIVVPGMISFVTDIYELNGVSGIESPTPIDSWQSGQYNQFSGGTFR